MNQINQAICLFDINNVSFTERIIIFDEITNRYGNGALLVLYTGSDANAFFGRRHQSPQYMIDIGSNLIDFKHLLLPSSNGISAMENDIDKPPKPQIKKKKVYQKRIRGVWLHPARCE